MVAAALADTGHHIAVEPAVADTCTDKGQAMVVSAHKGRSMEAAVRRDQLTADTLQAAVAGAAGPADRRDMMAMTDMDQVDWVDIA